MADNKQLKLIKESVEVWNRWRKENYQIAINLSVANLYKATLSGADLRGANLEGANLYKADLSHTDLGGANLRAAYLVDANLLGAKLSKAILTSATLSNATLFSADLCEADLSRADLTGVNLAYANLRSAILTEAKLRGVSLVGADINQAILKGCRIFGLSAWALKGVPKEQSSLVITDNGEPEITVDDLQVGQFIYLLLNNKNVRNVIDTITSKAVLILGRFTEERKAILDTLQAILRKRNYLPILFDFSGPENRDITETVSTLAHMARFIIADITDARSIP